MIIFVSWLDYLLVILILVIMVQVGVMIGIKLEEHYG